VIKMKNKLALLALVLTFSTMAVLILPAAPVAALGAPSDNTTIPNSPAGEQPQNEIKPPVEYVLLRATSQTETTPPGIIIAFTPASGNNEPVVTGDEHWYLDLDVNAPGWAYIYEYFPQDQAQPGQWLAYKWQLPESGLWRLGPFAPTDNEAEGQHAYRVWFYSGDQWAGSDQTSPNNLIYWTYTKNKPAESLSPPVTPVEEPGFVSRLKEFFTRPMVLGACLLAVVIGLALVLFFLWRRRSRLSVEEEISASFPDNLLLVPARARISLPDGNSIRLCGEEQVIGRADLSRALSLDELTLISRKHFQVKADGEHFYIEDLGSANGTTLNHKDISHQGPVKLADGDLIEPAGTVSLKFHLL